MKKIKLILITLILLTSITNANALNRGSEQNITDFLSTCNISNANNLSYSNHIPTYKDNLLVTDRDNYLVFSNSTIIGIVTDFNNIYTYTDLSEKNISTYQLTKFHYIEYKNDDLLIYLDNQYFSIIENDFFKQTPPLVAEEFVLNLQPLNIKQTRASSKYLSVPSMKQNTSYTCWATCIASVAKFYGKPTTDPSVISRNHGIDPTKRGATIGETQSAMKSQFGINSTIIAQGPSAYEIISLINSSKPLITGFVSNIYGHMVVVRGYSEGSSYLTVSYMDPATGTYKSTQVITDRKIQFTVGNTTYTSTTYLKL